MPKRKTPEEKPKDQFKRFQETVSNLQVDDSGKPLSDAFAQVVKSKPALKRPTSTDGDA